MTTWTKTTHTTGSGTATSRKPFVPINTWDQFFFFFTWSLGLIKMSWNLQQNAWLALLWFSSLKSLGSWVSPLGCDRYPDNLQWSLQQLSLSRSVLFLMPFFLLPFLCFLTLGERAPAPGSLFIIQHNVSEGHRCYCANKWIEPTHCCFLPADTCLQRQDCSQLLTYQWKASLSTLAKESSSISHCCPVAARSSMVTGMGHTSGCDWRVPSFRETFRDFPCIWCWP